MMKIIVVLLLGIPAISACGGVWDCVRADVASNLTSIFVSDAWNLTQDGRLVAERIRDSNGSVKKVAPNVGISGLIRDSIRVFDTHQLLWRAIPGVLDIKIFKHEGEGMDIGVDIPGEADGRTWRVGAMRRRITMALLPIMYKLGVSTTLLGVLVFIGLKTAAMVSVLFVLALGSLAKHKLGFSNYQSAHWTASPPPVQAAPVQKEVHVHVHANPHKQSDLHWLRKPPHDGYESIGSSEPDSFSGPIYSVGSSGYGSPYDEPQVLYRSPLRRWPTNRQSTVRSSSPWTSSPSWPPSQSQISGALPVSAYAMNPRWTWQRYMDQGPPLDLARPLHPEKIER